MQGLAANDAAKRDRTLVGLAGTLPSVERDGDRGSHLERSRHAHAVEDCAGFAQRARGTREQGVGDVLVETRLHDEDARAGEIARTAIVRISAGGSARLSHADVSPVSPWSYQADRVGSKSTQISPRRGGPRCGTMTGRAGSRTRSESQSTNRR